MTNRDNPDIGLTNRALAAFRATGMSAAAPSVEAAHSLLDRVWLGLGPIAVVRIVAQSRPQSPHWVRRYIAQGTVMDTPEQRTLALAKAYDEDTNTAHELMAHASDPGLWSLFQTAGMNMTWRDHTGRPPITQIMSPELVRQAQRTPTRGITPLAFVGRALDRQRAMAQACFSVPAVREQLSDQTAWGGSSALRLVQDNADKLCGAVDNARRALERKPGEADALLVRVRAMTALISADMMGMAILDSRQARPARPRPRM